MISLMKVAGLSLRWVSGGGAFMKMVLVVRVVS